MRAIQYRPLACQLQERVTLLLYQKLRPPDFSRSCSAWLLLSCLVLAAALRISLAAVAALRRKPSRETLRKARAETLAGYDELRQKLPALLTASLPRGLRRQARRRVRLAIDLHRVPYSKRRRTPPEHVRKGQRLPGTRYAHDYATVSLLRKGQYYVVAVTPDDPGESLADLVRRLLRQASGLGFSPRYVLLDRTFWTTDVIRYLQRARTPFVMPVAARGKKPTAPGGPTGTQGFFYDHPGGWFSYRLHNARGESAEVTVVVHRRRTADRKGRRTWAYALWGVEWARVRGVEEAYRRRFRIESSYRLLEAARARTSSRDEGLRLWYVVLAVLLENLWLSLRREASRGKAERAWFVRVLALLAHVLLKDAGAGGPGGASQTATPQGAPRQKAGP